MCIAFDQTTPSQIVFQVLGGDPVKAAHPALKAAVVSIDVLDVKYPADNPHATPDIDGAMGDTGRSGKDGIDAGAVCTEDRVAVDQRFEFLANMNGIQNRELKVGSLATAVAYDQHRNLFGVDAALVGNSATMTRRTR